LKSTETKRWVPVCGSSAEARRPTSSPVRAAGPIWIGTPLSSTTVFGLAGVDVLRVVLQLGLAAGAGDGARWPGGRRGAAARPTGWACVVSASAGRGRSWWRGRGCTTAADGALDGRGRAGAALGPAEAPGTAAPRAAGRRPGSGRRAEHRVEGQLGGLADRLGRLGGVLHAGQLDDDPVGAGAGQRRLGDAERVDAPAEHLEARSVASASASVVGLSWVSRTIEVPPRRSSPRRGSFATA
jgi:hypothetical protein